jgi:hypothetical protein
MRSAKRAAIEKQRKISLEELPRSTNSAISPTEQAGQGSNEMDKKNAQIAHRRIVAGREILRKYGRNNNSPATSFWAPEPRANTLLGSGR